jgi:type IV pilus assembly protein PilW
MTSPPYNTTHRTAFRERGLTMMELLITVVILGLLMTGLSQLVVTNSKNATATGDLARIADTGRTAIQLLAADIRRAGYLGGYVGSLDAAPSRAGTLGVPAYANNCVADTTAWATMVNQPIFGINAPDDDSTIAYDCITDGGEDEDKWLRGDVLTVRYTLTPPVDVADMLVDVADIVVGKIYLRATLDQRRLLLFKKGDDVSVVASGENEIDDPTVRNFALAAHAYFVGLTERKCQGRPIPALFRATIGDGGLPETQELLAGVENLQLRYLVGNRYFDAGEESLESGEWPRVDAVEISVLVRAECPETGFDINRTFELGDVSYTPADKDFRRQVFTTTTHLRN